MESVYLLFSIFYAFFAFCLLSPPTEFVSAGLTIQNVFSDFLGSEDLNFIYYHIKRTTITPAIHSLLPLGYYLCLALFAPELELFNLWRASTSSVLFLIASILLVIVLCLRSLYWSRNHWNNHPIAKQLGYLGNHDSWRAVASSINVEFRRIDKFTSGTPGNRVIVTDTWVMKVTVYDVNINHQDAIHLSLANTEEHHVSYENQINVQYLGILVHSINPKIRQFSIRLNSLEYGELRQKLQAPVTNARNIVIKQSLDEQFLEEFSRLVAENPSFNLTDDMDVESCIGCMQKPSDIKLQKLCDEHNEGDCQQCYCRPMWCLECMGKWFASRQDQQRPETWLSGKSPCPTCRAKFCLLDVCKIVEK